MSTLTLLSRLLIFSLTFLLFGQLFGTCVFPDTGKYQSRMQCVSHEWERRFSYFIHMISDGAEDRVKEEIGYPSRENDTNPSETQDRPERLEF